MTRGRTVLAGLAGLAAVLTLAGCEASDTGHGPDSPSAASTSPVSSVRPVAAVPTHRATTSTAAASPSTPTAPVAAWTPCTANARAHLVYVSLARQHLWMCAGARTDYSTGITSGMVGQYTNTPTGSFTIQAKTRDTTLNVKENGRYTAYPVKYWIPFDAPLFGFHDSSWQTFPYGSDRYRTDGSHGCVHMPLAAIAHLYDWAPVGTAVTIVP